jgi:hypothetical protein
MKTILIGNYVGIVNVIDDEPTPTLSVTRRVTAFEGKSLIWNFQLSGPVTEASVFCDVIRPRRGTELSSNDVAHSWILAYGGSLPLRATPLSQLGLFVYVDFRYGMTEASLVIPIAVDTIQENTEKIALICYYNGWDRSITLEGTVRSQNRTR